MILKLKSHLLVLVGGLFLSSIMPVFAEDILFDLSEIDACKKISLDRDRLFCFDEAVNTPLFAQEPIMIAPAVNTNYPKEWLSAHRMDKKRHNELEGFWETETSLEHYDSLFLTQAVEDLGIVVFSCVNNISRVEVMLDKPMKEGIVSVVVSGNSQENRQWLLDDTGYILREGRGLPSIAMMRGMIGLSQFTLTVNDRHYTLSLNQFDNQVKRLQTLCHWR